MKRLLLFSVILSAFIAGPAAGQANVTVSAGGVYPAGTLFSSVPINALQSGYGVEIAANGSAVGQFCTILVGVNARGIQQNITIVGKASVGSKTAINIVRFSGTCSVDMGDGTLAAPGVPFTAAITTDTNDQGTIGLVIGATTLPNAVVNAGSMTIK